MSDLINYDKECNYLDLKNQNANIMLDKCTKDNINIFKDNCNIKNSELNSINRENMTNINNGLYNNFIDNNLIDNNLINKTNNILNNSLECESESIINLNKNNLNNYLNIYNKKVEDNIYDIVINKTGKIDTDLIGIKQLYNIKNIGMINKKDTLLIDDNLNNINNRNDKNEFNKINNNN